MSTNTRHATSTTKKKRMAMAVAAGSMAAAASLASIGSASAAPVRPTTAPSVHLVPGWWCCGVPADIFTQFDPGGFTLPGGGQIQFGG